MPRIFLCRPCCLGISLENWKWSVLCDIMKLFAWCYDCLSSLSIFVAEFERENQDASYDIIIAA